MGWFVFIESFIVLFQINQAECNFMRLSLSKQDAAAIHYDLTTTHLGLNSCTS